MTRGRIVFTPWLCLSMTRATKCVNDNLINKRGIFDDLMELNHRYARQKRPKRQKSDTGDSIFGIKSGPALAGPATTAVNCVDKWRHSGG